MAEALNINLDHMRKMFPKLSMNPAFACSLRIGELLGLTWDCVDISQESMDAGTAYIYINKELQRVNRNVSMHWIKRTL